MAPALITATVTAFPTGGIAGSDSGIGRAIPLEIGSSSVCASAVGYGGAQGKGCSARDCGARCGGGCNCKIWLGGGGYGDGDAVAVIGSVGFTRNGGNTGAVVDGAGG